MITGNSAGAHERLVTLTGTVPTWARYGTLQIDGYDALYKVAEYKNTTTFTLDSLFNPGADVDAGTEFTLFRSVYPLPDVHRLHQISDESGWWRGRYVTPDEWLARERHLTSAGGPFFWTITGASDLFGAMAVRLAGYPDEAETLDFICCRKPRRLFIDGIQGAWTDGTVTSASGTAVAISGNTFASEVVNSVLRLSRTTAQPTDAAGDNPYIDQRIITEADGSDLTVDDTIDADGVAISTGYCISDPIDLPEYLMDLFKAWCRLELCKTSVRDRLKEARGDLVEARKAARTRDNFVDTPVLSSPWTHPAWQLLQGSISTTEDSDLLGL